MTEDTAQQTQLDRSPRHRLKRRPKGICVRAATCWSRHTREGRAILMSEDNKHNLLYFESPTMRGLYSSMEEWQHLNHRRLLSISIQQEGESYCCIALTNPTEVVITSDDGRAHADVQEITYMGRGLDIRHTGKYGLQ